MWLTAALVSLGYFIGVKIGFALTFQPHPISTLWPPNSILLAALLITKPRYWWLLLTAAFPAHLAAQVQGGVPSIQIVAWFVSNCSQALIGAGAICLLVGCPLRFESFRDVCIFIAVGALIAPFVSTFIDVAFVTAIGWVQGSYATLWRLRFFSNVLTTLTFVPVIVTCVSLGPQILRSAPVRHYVEAAALFLWPADRELPGICGKLFWCQCRASADLCAGAISHLGRHPPGTARNKYVVVDGRAVRGLGHDSRTRSFRHLVSGRKRVIDATLLDHAFDHVVVFVVSGRAEPKNSESITTKRRAIAARDRCGKDRDLGLVNSKTHRDLVERSEAHAWLRQAQHQYAHA